MTAKATSLIATSHPVYGRWASIIGRCKFKSHSGWRYCGLKGIKICKRWEKFENFLHDMGAIPFPGAVIKRKNTNGDYTPENCYWDSVHKPAQNRIDLTGEEFGRLLVLGVSGSGKNLKWKCHCCCGKTTIIQGSHLRLGHTKSCGCLSIQKFAERSFKHGLSKSSEYKRWRAMRTRCENPNCGTFKYYGGRGIKVCKRWNKFENFFEDMGKVPSPSLTLERINNAKGYSPNNCKWATRSEQAYNRRKKNTA